jgi:hypothetical protein
MALDTPGRYSDLLAQEAQAEADLALVIARLARIRAELDAEAVALMDPMTIPTQREYR